MCCITFYKFPEVDSLSDGSVNGFRASFELGSGGHAGLARIRPARLPALRACPKTRSPPQGAVVWWAVPTLHVDFRTVSKPTYSIRFNGRPEKEPAGRNACRPGRPFSVLSAQCKTRMKLNLLWNDPRADAMAPRAQRMAFQQTLALTYRNGIGDPRKRHQAESRRPRTLRRIPSTQEKSCRRKGGLQPAAQRQNSSAAAGQSVWPVEPATKQAGHSTPAYS